MLGTMKRDMELIRRLLLAMETHSPLGAGRIRVAGFDDETIAYHCYLLHQADYIEAANATSMDGFDCIPLRITFSGQQFLATIRDDTIWQKIQTRVGRHLADLPLEVVSKIGTKLAEQWVIDHLEVR
jgi:Hypothetical protein (DUF2513)